MKKNHKVSGLVRVSMCAILALGVSWKATAQQDAPDDDTSYPLTDGIYLGIAGGGNWPGQISPHGGNADDHSEYKAGYIGTGIIGYGFGDGFRVELEGGYRRNDVGYVRNSPNKAYSGALGMYTAMVNGLYDFEVGSFISPHLGVGAGYARPQFDNAGYYSLHTLHGEDNLFAYQGIAGLSVALTPDLKATLDYHYLGTTQGKYRTDLGAHTNTSFVDHAVLIGVRYEFNAPRPVMAAAVAPPASPPPMRMAAAPPPPPPPIAEVQHTFEVFFNWDKSDITPDAAIVIRQAADAVKKGNRTRINVTGHTDTSGSGDYNQSLSTRRAEAVKAELLKNGVASQEVVTLGVGEADLLIPTKDGVREAQNRRAEIMIK